jgi:lipopolysaccharide transport system ATP-binding protein
MTDKAIQVQGISKRYFIGASKERSQESLREWLAARVRRGRHDAREEAIWALKDVSFSVSQGEIVGVIGRNGAGKSTLLKILSRITEPTSGKVVLNGRVGSLLEVGTGFHPELTGRENIYLSGAILGMTRAEIGRNFDEIVAFSELEKFIDTPVKRYSSGMSVRLGFAVAAHLEPEILLVDEVLAVGDANFQKKSLGKMGDVAHGGRTVLFVSHNMAMVNKICGRALLIDGGHLVGEGETAVIVRQYVGLNRGEVEALAEDNINRWSLANQDSEEIVIRDVELLTADGSSVGQRDVEDNLTVRLHYTAKRPILSPGFIVMLRTQDGIELCRVSNVPISGFHVEKIAGDGMIEVSFEALPFTGGRYFVSVAVARANVRLLLSLPDVAWFNMAKRDVYGSGLALETNRGYLFVSHKWRHQAGTSEWSQTARSDKP